MAQTRAGEWIPKGFQTGLPTALSPALAARICRLPPKAPPQRIVAVRALGATPEAVDAFLARDGLWAPRVKAPGVYEVDVFPADIARLTERRDLFAWIDAATRLFGKALPESAAATQVTVEVAVSDPAAAEKRIRFVGGSVAARAEGALTARVPAGKLGALLAGEGIDAVEVK